MSVLDYNFALFFSPDKKENDFFSTKLRAAVLCDLAGTISVHGVLIPFELVKVPRGCNLW